MKPETHYAKPGGRRQVFMFCQAPAAGFADARHAPADRYRRVRHDRPRLGRLLRDGEITGATS
jgi:hypothetical protein